MFLINLKIKKEIARNHIYIAEDLRKERSLSCLILNGKAQKLKL
jgi:hypothetical protein